MYRKKNISYNVECERNNVASHIVWTGVQKFMRCNIKSQDLVELKHKCSIFKRSKVTKSVDDSYRCQWGTWGSLCCLPPQHDAAACSRLYPAAGCLLPAGGAPSAGTQMSGFDGSRGRRLTRTLRLHSPCSDSQSSHSWSILHLRKRKTKVLLLF